jgi:type II secretory pathway pseudopilin PulG
MKPTVFARCGLYPNSLIILRDQSAFALIEFLLSALIFLSVSAAVFNTMAEIQRVAGYQSEVQSVLDNTRIALETTVSLLQQAGNDPFLIGLAGITIIGNSQVQLQSDIAGSAGPGSPDKGDPDGDISDSAENVILKYNPGTRTLNLAQSGGAAQAVAAGISGFSLVYYDANGLLTNQGSEVRRVTVSVSGASQLPDPQTGRIFAVELVSDVRILTRP